jgi:pimeloyl-ACP methyl ester carboxylesterase
LFLGVLLVLELGYRCEDLPDLVCLGLAMVVLDVDTGVPLPGRPEDGYADDLAAGPFYGFNRPGVEMITVPVLVMHGDDDQIVPYADSVPLSAELLQNGTLQTYAGFPHGMPTTHADVINADLLEFIRS